MEKSKEDDILSTRNGTLQSEGNVSETQKRLRRQTYSMTLSNFALQREVTKRQKAMCHGSGSIRKLASEANKNDGDEGLSNARKQKLATGLLVKAILEGNMEKVEEALILGADPNEKVDEVGLTPFLLCVQEGHYFIFNALLSNGADPDIIDSKFRNAFYFACFGSKIASGDHAKFVTRLLAHYSEVNKHLSAEQMLMGSYASHHQGVTECILQTIPWKILSKDSNGWCKVNVQLLEVLDSPCTRVRWPDGSYSSYGKTPLHVLLDKRNAKVLMHPACLALMHWKWNTFGKRFFFWETVLYFSQILCVTSVIYLSSLHSLKSGNGSGRLDEYDMQNSISILRLALECTSVVLAFVILFVVSKLVSFPLVYSKEKRQSTFSEPLSALGVTIASQSCVILLSFLRIVGAETRTQLVFLAITGILQFDRYIYIMSLTRRFGPFFIMLVEMFKRDIVPFGLILIALLIAFGASIGLLVSHRYEDDPTSIVFHNLPTSILELCFSLVGTDGFNTIRAEWFRSDEADGLVILLIVVYNIAGPILAVNLLVAMMANTYSAINRNSVAEWAYRRFRFLCLRESFVRQPYFGHSAILPGKRGDSTVQAVHPKDSSHPKFQQNELFTTMGFTFEDSYSRLFEPYHNQTKHDTSEDLHEMMIALLVQVQSLSSQVAILTSQKDKAG